MESNQKSVGLPLALLAALVLFAALTAHAQIASLGKGWLLNAPGSITSTPGQVISGNNSIMGSYSGLGTYSQFLQTDPNFIQFAANQQYTITLSYRIITAGSNGFSFGFFTPSDNTSGYSNNITGTAGTSGTATLVATLKNYPDYLAGFDINGTGTIVIDNIQITNSNGQLVASENAEGPTVVPGLLNFQLTGAIAMLTPASAAPGAVAKALDLNGNGNSEVLMTLIAPPPTNVPIEPMVVEATGPMKIATSNYFPAGAPTVKACQMLLFADISGDGLPDLIFSEAGYDPSNTGIVLTGSRIGVALNLGGGKYKDVSSLIPADQQTTVSNSIAVGDVLGDGGVEIILPDLNNGSNTALLRWNGNGFDEIRNWIPQSLWGQSGLNLRFQAWMDLADVDLDGRQDLLLGGNGETAPNLQLVFGGAGGFAMDTVANYLQLPDGPFGHTDSSQSFPPILQGAEVKPILVADFNNDGLPDILTTERQYLRYQPGAFTDTSDPNYANLKANGGLVFGGATYQVLLNQGSRNFLDVTPSPAASLGGREYTNLVAIDINNDGFLDVVGTYQVATNIYGTPPYIDTAPPFLYGTTLFLNDGTGRFQVVDGAQLLVAATTTPPNGKQWNLGSFVPTVVAPDHIEGIVYEGVGGCPTAFCPAPGLNIYKVVSTRSIGTGPGFVDPATLGAPGFNEFYYLTHYPDAAAAVAAGLYPSGLAQYLAVGMAKGYLPHAPNPLKTPAITSVSNAAGGQPGVVPGSFASIYGSNFTILTSDSWNQFISNGSLPAELDGVSVSIGGKPAYVESITPGQINVQAPNVAAGPVNVVVTTPGGTSQPFSATAQAYGPAFFTWPGNQAVATHANFSWAVKNGTFPSTSTAPAAAGEVVTLWGTGFGPTNPAVPAGQEPSVIAPPTQLPVSVTLRGTPVTVWGAVLSGYAGTYQIAIQIPDAMPSGDYPIVATVDGVQSPSTVILSVLGVQSICGTVGLSLTPNNEFAAGTSAGGSAYTWTLNGPTIGQGAMPQLALFHYDGSLQDASGISPVTATGTSFVPGKFGSALSVASNGVLTYPATGNVSVTDGTIEMWLGMSGDGSAPAYSGYVPLFSYTAANGDQLMLFDSGGKGFYGGTTVDKITTGTGTGGSPFTNITAWHAGDWHHVAMTYSSTQGQLVMYIDGQISGRLQESIPMPAADGQVFTIGNNGNGSGSPFLIDEVLISNYAKTPAEIQYDFSRNTPFGNNEVLLPLTGLASGQLGYSVLATSSELTCGSAMVQIPGGG